VNEKQAGKVFNLGSQFSTAAVGGVTQCSCKIKKVNVYFKEPIPDQVY